MCTYNIHLACLLLMYVNVKLYYFVHSKRLVIKLFFHKPINVDLTNSEQIRMLFCAVVTLKFLSFNLR